MEKADLKAGEREILEAERSRLKSADALYNLSYQSSQLLSNSGYDIDAFEILNPLRVVKENLEKLARIDEGT